MKSLFVTFLVSAVTAAPGFEGYVEPGIVVSLSSEYVSQQTDRFFNSLLAYVNNQYEASGSSRAIVEFDFAKVSFSNFRVTDSQAFINAHKTISISGKCPHTFKPSPSAPSEDMNEKNEKQSKQTIDPDIVVQQGCISGEISKMDNLSFEIDYSMRIDTEPFKGRATVTLSDVSVDF